jgi:hypothetical protein
VTIKGSDGEVVGAHHHFLLFIALKDSVFVYLPCHLEAV